MTSLPDWLVERAALDEVAPASRARVDGADARELADRIAGLRAANDAELAAHPAAPAVAQIDARVAAARRRRNRQRYALVGVMSATAAAMIVLIALPRTAETVRHDDDEEITRVKGSPRLLAFRSVDGEPEPLDHDALVRAGDLIQLRYNAGGRSHGVIASIDGAGVVTLHFPVSEGGTTALAAKPTSLPNSYALDDAPRFERFFFITADQPIDVESTLGSLRSLASRADSATASLELPAGLHQWSLRLRKPKAEDRHE